MGYNIERQIRRGHAEYNALIHKTTARYNLLYGALKRRVPGETKAARAAEAAALEAEKVATIAKFAKDLAAIHPTGGWAIGSDINVLATLGDMMDESKADWASPTNPGGTRKGYALQCTIWNRSGESASTTKAVLKRARLHGLVKSSASKQSRSCLDYWMPDVWQKYYADRDQLMATIETDFEGTVAADFYDEEQGVNDARDAEATGTAARGSLDQSGQEATQVAAEAAPEADYGDLYADDHEDADGYLEVRFDSQAPTPAEEIVDVETVEPNEPSQVAVTAPQAGEDAPGATVTDINIRRPHRPTALSQAWNRDRELHQLAAADPYMRELVDKALERAEQAGIGGAILVSGGGGWVVAVSEEVATDVWVARGTRDRVGRPAPDSEAELAALRPYLPQADGAAS